MDIPKVLHQTWKDSQVPDAFSDYVATWKANHPDWNYRLWTDIDNRRFIAEHYSWFLETYDSYPRPIQRADVVRYFILHKYGGVYVDLDFLSRKPMTTLLRGRQCVLGVEPLQHCRQFGVEKLICNALMASVPRHPFFETVIHRLGDFVDCVECKQPVISSTGPLMLTRVYEQFCDKSSMDVLPSQHFYPLNLDEAAEYRLLGKTQVDLSNSVAVHLYYGNWWKPSWWDAQRRTKLKVAAAARACLGYASALGRAAGSYLSPQSASERSRQLRYNNSDDTATRNAHRGDSEINRPTTQPPSDPASQQRRTDAA